MNTAISKSSFNRSLNLRFEEFDQDEDEDEIEYELGGVVMLTEGILQIRTAKNGGF